MFRTIRAVRLTLGSSGYRHRPLRRRASARRHQSLDDGGAVGRLRLGDRRRSVGPSDGLRRSAIRRRLPIDRRRSDLEFHRRRAARPLDHGSRDRSGDAFDALCLVLRVLHLQVDRSRRPLGLPGHRRPDELLRVRRCRGNRPVVPVDGLRRDHRRGLEDRRRRLLVECRRQPRPAARPVRHLLSERFALEGNILAGLSGHGLFRSVDRADNWTSVLSAHSSQTVNQIAFDSSNVLVVWAAGSSFNEVTGESSGGVFRSVDGGVTWALVMSLPNEPFIGVSVDPFSPAVYVSSQTGGVGRRFSGATWSPSDVGAAVHRRAGSRAGPVRGSGTPDRRAPACSRRPTPAEAGAAPAGSSAASSSATSPSIRRRTRRSGTRIRGEAEAASSEASTAARVERLLRLAAQPDQRDGGAARKPRDRLRRARGFRRRLPQHRRRDELDGRGGVASERGRRCRPPRGASDRSGPRLRHGEPPLRLG